MINDLIISAPLWSLFLFSLIPLSIKVLNKNREYSFFVSRGIGISGYFYFCFSLVSYVAKIRGGNSISFFFRFGL